MRHELKYVITPVQAQLLRGRLCPLMKRDKHAGEDGNYFIRSVYFDSPEAVTLAEKESGVDNRRKYRIRYYENDPKYSFLECKSKKGTRISKDSIQLTEQELVDLLAGRVPEPETAKGQKPIAAEANADTENGVTSRRGTVLEDLAVLMKTKGFAPAIVVDYLREAYVYDVSNVRITFDQELAGGKPKDCLQANRYLPNILQPGDMVLEVKYDEYLPAHIAEVLSSIGLVQVAASKFGMCMKSKLEGRIL